MTNKNTNFDNFLDFSFDATINELPASNKNTNEKIGQNSQAMEKENSFMNFDFDILETPKAVEPPIISDKPKPLDQSISASEPQIGLEQNENSIEEVNVTTELQQKNPSDFDIFQSLNQSQPQPHQTQVLQQDSLSGLDSLLNTVGINQTQQNTEMSTIDAIANKKQERDNIAQQANDMMNAGRKSAQSSTKRKKVVEQKNSYFILEHDPTYVADEDSDYDLYYEDVLPIDYKEVQNQSTNKGTFKKALIALAIISVLIFVIIYVSNILTQPEF